MENKTNNKAEQKTAFVFGATGYAGGQVVLQLLDNGTKTIAHIRPDRKDIADISRQFEELGAICDCADWSISSLQRSFEKYQPDYIYCLIGTTKKRMSKLSALGQSKQSASYQNVDYGLSAMLIKAALLAGIKKCCFIYLSSLGASKSAGAYLHARYAVEQELHDSNLPYIIIRPAIISGTDRVENRLGERILTKGIDTSLACLKSFGFGNFAKSYSSITALRLAENMIRLAVNDQNYYRTFSRVDLD